jgi:cell division protease FtsH
MHSYYASVKEILIQNRPVLKAVAAALLEKETLNEYELDDIISSCRERLKGTA